MNNQPTPPFYPGPYSKPSLDKPAISTQPPRGTSTRPQVPGGGIPPRLSTDWLRMRLAAMQPGQGPQRQRIMGRLGPSNAGGFPPSTDPYTPGPTKPSPFPKGPFAARANSISAGTPAPPFYPGPYSRERGPGPPPPQDGEMWPSFARGGPDAAGSGRGGPAPFLRPYLSPQQVLQILMGNSAPSFDQMNPPPTI